MIPNTLTKCEERTEPMLPCYACASQGPKGYRCQRVRGHDDDECCALAREDDALKGEDLVRWRRVLS